MKPNEKRRVILKTIFNRLVVGGGGGDWNGLVWLRVGTSSVLY